MREFSPEFAAHIATGATTLCNCWRIAKNNGEELGFTDHDQQIMFDHTDFLPTAGMSPSTLVQKAGGSIDTSEIVGWIDDCRIAREHILDGQFAGARVELWKVNWRDVAVRHHFRTDFIGEIVERDRTFTAELRSQHVKLNQTGVRLFQRECSANFGDSACGIDTTLAAYSAHCTIDAIKDDKTVLVSGLGARQAGWARGGKVVWLDGARKNRTIRISNHERHGNTHILYLSEPDFGLAAVGDRLRVTIGCDKRFSTCREKFRNQYNFQGFPHIPGEDFVLQYPNDIDETDGSALIK